MLVQLQLDDLGADYFTARSAMIGAVTLDGAKRVAKRLLDNGMLVTVVGKPAGVASTTANSARARISLTLDPGQFYGDDPRHPRDRYRRAGD